MLLLHGILWLLAACVLSPIASRQLGRRAGWLLTIPLVVSAIVILTASYNVDFAVVEQTYPWMPSLDFNLAFRVDGLSLVFALIVLLIGAVVFSYSSSYLGKGVHSSFFVPMTVFATAMLALVLADDVVMMFIAWEVTTVCSFLLIARSGPEAREPAIRTILVTMFGGLNLLTAVAILTISTGTTQLSVILTDPFWHESGMSSAVLMLIAIAALTKSAQFPFQSWLPDSMVAITPVSTYLHAAAMVKAGIYLLLRFSPVASDVTIWNVILVTSGVITALFGAICALQRYDLKELLAYSTMSQLGLLVVMIGIGTPLALTAAVVHTVAHALFKAALFMLVGVLDHETGTRDIRRLAEMRLRMPIAFSGIVLAAASMAGVPLLFGFISKESIFTALVEFPGSSLIGMTLTVLLALVSVFTFAYSGRIILGARGGSTGPTVRESAALLWLPPVLCSAIGVVLGVAPGILDQAVTNAVSVVVGQSTDVHLLLWHGWVPALLVSGIVVLGGLVLIVLRYRVHPVLLRLDLGWSGLRVVDGARSFVIGQGGRVAGWAGSTEPHRHLLLPVISLLAIATAGFIRSGSMPTPLAANSQGLDWVLVVLIAAGVFAATRVQSRLAALVVTGVVGFSMTVWYFALGAADVAMTQLLVEILTVCVMVLLLRRLPEKFRSEGAGRPVGALAVAIGAGIATTLGVLALTGNNDMSNVAEYYLREGEATTGGANIVNTILVDFRALDTLGELTVLGVTGIAVTVLLSVRKLAPLREGNLDLSSDLGKSRDNGVFLRTIQRRLVPLIILLSGYLFFRGHQEPGGGFIAALVAGAGIALVLLAAQEDVTVVDRWPFLTLIGAGILLGVSTGLFGLMSGSFLAPLHVDVLGMKLSSTLVFDLGVSLAVVGVIVATFSLLGRHVNPNREERKSDDNEGQSKARDGGVSR